MGIVTPMPSEERDAEMLGRPLWIGQYDGSLVNPAGYMASQGAPAVTHRAIKVPVAEALVEITEAAKEWRAASDEFDPTRMSSANRVTAARRRLTRALDNLDAALGGGRNG